MKTKAARPARRQPGPKSGRSIELAKIHIAAEQLHLIRPADDSAYRDMLWSIGRVRSAANLDSFGRQAVLKHLKTCGFVDRPSGSARYENGTPAALIRWLWTQLANAGAVRDSSDRALRRYIAQHGGITGDTKPEEVAPQHLNRDQTSTVIEQLKSWLKRTEAEVKP